MISLITRYFNPLNIARIFPRHFDKDHSGKLNHVEFKACLRSLGYDLPILEEGQEDPVFEEILNQVDPNR